MPNIDIITNYKINEGWLPIISAVFSLEIIFIVIYSKISPILRKWYVEFGLLAVIADIFVIIIAFAIARYIYTLFVESKYKSAIAFIITLLLVQIIHDLIYYFVIVKPWSKGTNSIIDYMKVYGEKGKLFPILGDSSMVISMSILAIILSKLPQHVSVVILFVSIYMIPYVLTNKYLQNY